MRQSSHLHIHAPYHVQFAEGHFLQHVKDRLQTADGDKNEELTLEEFEKLVDYIIEDHMVETSGTELAPHPIHIDDVFKDFDENGDGFVSREEMKKFLACLYKVILTPETMKSMRENGVEVWALNWD